jgi:hypothetical protein
MKTPSLLFFSLLAISSFGQSVVADFENISLTPNSYNNGSDLQGGFQSGSAFFPNDYDADIDFWVGWAISNKTDVTTPGFTNQYSAITGSGFESSNYAVAYESYITNDARVIFDEETELDGFYVTNSTYTYLSMLEGDAFSKQFGGITGNDPDFFLLTIRAFHNGELSQASVEFYLADYTFADNSLDYIVDEWTFVDLSSLGSADSLSLSLSSSDVGEFGMNTPAYFCIDNFITTAPLSVKTAEKELFKIYPNPATDRIHVSMEIMPESISVIDICGRMVLQKNQSRELNISGLNRGTYLIRIVAEGEASTQKFLKY